MKNAVGYIRRSTALQDRSIPDQQKAINLHDTNMRFLKFFTLIILFMSNVFAQITFSEIMFDVSTNEYHDEFVKIFNFILIYEKNIYDNHSNFK